MNPVVIAQIIIAIVTVIQNCPKRNRKSLIARMQSPGPIERMLVNHQVQQQLNVSPEDFRQHVKPYLDEFIYGQANLITEEMADQFFEDHNIQFTDSDSQG